MTNKKPLTTAYEWERIAKKALLELKVQTSLNELSKGKRKLSEGSSDPLRMIVKQQYDLNNSGELFHTSHLSDKLFLETVRDDHGYIFASDTPQVQQVEGSTLTADQMRDMSAKELFDYANKEAGQT